MLNVVVLWFGALAAVRQANHFAAHRVIFAVRSGDTNIDHFRGKMIRSQRRCGGQWHCMGEDCCADLVAVCFCVSTVSCHPGRDFFIVTGEYMRHRTSGENARDRCGKVSPVASSMTVVNSLISSACFGMCCVSSRSAHQADATTIDHVRDVFMAGAIANGKRRATALRVMFIGCVLR